MRLIDHWAYANRLRRVDPVFKALLSASTLTTALLLNRVPSSLVGVVGLTLIAVVWAGIPWRVFGAVLLAESSFLVLSAFGIALSLQPVTGWSDATGVSIGIARVTWSDTSVEAAARVFSRALAGCAAVNLLALTTPVIDVIALLYRLRLPTPLVELMSVVYRAIFVLLDSLDRMRVAQDNRLGYAGFRQGVRSAAMLAARLFLDAYQRSQRLHTAQLSRGYVNQFTVLETAYSRDSALIWAGSALLILMVAAGAWQ